MTPEELLKLAQTYEGGTLFSHADKFAKGYLALHAAHAALSVKLEETQEELESNRRCNLFTWKERAEQAEVKLEAAEKERDELSLTAISSASVSRAKRWHPGGLTDWSALEWAGAMAGEAGEACNAAKKLKRIEDGIANINTEEGRSLVEHDAACMQIAKEVADTILYGVLLCASVGVPIVPVLVDVFNRKSEEYGFPERIFGRSEASRGEVVKACPACFELNQEVRDACWACGKSLEKAVYWQRVSKP